MIEIGKIQELQVTGKSEHGLYLNDKGAEATDDIFLPKNQMPQDIEIGDEIEVFVYIGSDDKTIVTVKKPNLTLGELGLLRVVEVTEFGAFLDWGLEKDLLLPTREQVGKVTAGDLCLVGLDMDKSTNKLSATMNIYDLLSTDSPYKKNDRTRGTVYNINKDIGVFVAVDNTYHGLILNKEVYGNYKIGDNVEVRIKNVREDGKLELSLRNQAHSEIEGDAQKIIERLKANDGKLQLNDKSSPDHIKDELNISKAAFKRAIGKLLKEGAIKITDEGVELMW